VTQSSETTFVKTALIYYTSGKFLNKQCATAVKIQGSDIRQRYIVVAAIIVVMIPGMVSSSHSLHPWLALQKE
jgi:hypothetical protein